jgi:MFS family permease
VIGQSTARRIGAATDAFHGIAPAMVRRGRFVDQYGLQFAGLMVFANIAATRQLALSLVLYAPGYGGAIPLRPSLQGEYFGRRCFGAIQGIIVLGGALGNQLGPVFAGWMYDTLGNYQQAFWLMALVAAAAVPACLAIPRSPRTSLCDGSRPASPATGV